MIKILVVGKLKEKWWREACLEYQKRLQKYCKLEIVEVADQIGDEKNILEKEKQLLFSKIKDKDFVVTLEIDGKMLSSIELANKIEKWQMSYSDIIFVIGGSYGLSDDIKKRSNASLSFSKLTFPHQLFRVMLLEQIYRAFKIQNHETYHK